MIPPQAATGTFQAQRRKEEAETMKLCSQVLWKKHEYKARKHGETSGPRLSVALVKAWENYKKMPNGVHGV